METDPGRVLVFIEVKRKFPKTCDNIYSPEVFLIWPGMVVVEA